MSGKTYILRILAYQADRQDGHKLDDAIAACTKPWNPNTLPSSHIELHDPLTKRCFSSTLRDGDKGVRWADYEEVTRNKGRWEVFEKKFSRLGYLKIIGRADSIIGRKYYKIGIVLHFFLPLGWMGDVLGKLLDRFYCSMAVLFALIGKRKRISPRRLTTWAKKNGWKHLGNLAEVEANR